MKEYQNDAAFKLLSSVGQVMEDLMAPRASDHTDTSEIEGEKDETEKRNEEVYKRRDEVEKAVETEVTQHDVVAMAAIMDDDANRLSSNEPTEDEPAEDDATKSDKVVSKKLGYNRFMIKSPWEAGKLRLESDNVYKTRVDAIERTARNKKTYRAVISEMKRRKEAGQSSISKEKSVQQPSWTRKAMEIYPEFYK